MEVLRNFRKFFNYGSQFSLDLGRSETWVLLRSSEDLTLKEHIVIGSGEEVIEGVSKARKQ